MHSGQGTAQGHQTAGSRRRQGPDQHPLRVRHQHPQWEHDPAAPLKAALVQACGCPESPPTADSESAWQEGLADGWGLCGAAGQNCGTAAFQGPALYRGQCRLFGLALCPENTMTDIRAALPERVMLRSNDYEVA